jgi:chaperone BCS1
VIDGVASHEGRVLIMTSNHPENLDEALTRPGRVDMRIPFTLATHTQIKDIFIRMYTNDARKSNIQSQPKSSLKGRSKSTKDAHDDDDEDDISALLFEKPVAETLDRESLRYMAVAFADTLPESIFSPAAIQGFLLTRKREPRRALEEVAAWRDKQLKASDEKRK